MTTNTPAAGSTRQNHSPWLFLDAAQEVFTVAKERVYKPEEAHGDLPRGITVVLEELPKLATLKEVLEEIEHKIYLNLRNGTPVDKEDGPNAVVVRCTDEGHANS